MKLVASNSLEWDEDIAAMSLAPDEKNGLQVFRNYQRAFDDYGEKRLSQEIDASVFDFETLAKLTDLIAIEEPRFIPMVACAFADNTLKAMFKAYVPDDLPGGKRALFGPYGPITGLASQLQLAFAFDMISKDIIGNFSALRGVRNNISHAWDSSRMHGFFAKPELSSFYPVEDLLGGVPGLSAEILETLDGITRFRIRMILIVTRLAYEAPYYAKARKARLDPSSALYGNNSPALLERIAKAAFTACLRLVASR